jgi:hypothetical protein
MKNIAAGAIFTSAAGLKRYQTTQKPSCQALASIDLNQGMTRPVF